LKVLWDILSLKRFNEGSKNQLANTGKSGNISDPYEVMTGGVNKGELQRG